MSGYNIGRKRESEKELKESSTRHDKHDLYSKCINEKRYLREGIGCSQEACAYYLVPV